MLMKVRKGERSLSPFLYFRGTGKGCLVGLTVWH
jgi:hypothetical protein